MYTIKGRAADKPLNLDIDRLVAGSRGRDLSRIFDAVWSDTEFFTKARRWSSTLGCDNKVVTQENYAFNGTLGFDAWKRVMEFEENFPSLTSLTLPLTHRSFSLPVIQADNLVFLQLIPVRVRRYFDKVRPVYKGWQPEFDIEDDRSYGLANLTEFLAPLSNLETLIIAHLSIDIEEDTNSTQTHFSKLLDVRISSEDTTSISMMQACIVTPLDWNITTRTRSDEELKLLTASKVAHYDTVTIDRAFRIVFVTFSTWAVEYDGANSRSPLDLNFVHEAVTDRRLNLHVARDHVTVVWRPGNSRAFPPFMRSFDNLLINRLPPSFETQPPDSGRLQRDWDFLGDLDYVQRVKLNEDCCIDAVLRHIRPPKRLSLYCFSGGSRSGGAIGELGTMIEKWKGSQHDIPIITISVDICLPPSLRNSTIQFPMQVNVEERAASCSWAHTPDEVVTYILLLASDAFRTGTAKGFVADRSSMRLREVCSRWNSLLNGSPWYWRTLLGCAADEDGWVAMLEKTGVVPVVISTGNYVPLKLQADAISRAEQAYLTRHDTGTKWNSVLSNAGSLPLLTTLQLSRRLAVGHDDNALRLDAPNLRELSIDCDGHVMAPALRSLKITNVNSALALLSRVFQTCPHITDLYIDAPSCNNKQLWQDIYSTIAPENIEYLTVSFMGWTSAPPLPAKIMPKLRTLRTSVPTPTLSPMIERLDVNQNIIDVLQMLRGMPTLKTLTLGAQTYCAGELQLESPVTLPLCTRIDFLQGLYLHAFDILDVLHVPRVTALNLHYFMRTGREQDSGSQNPQKSDKTSSQAPSSEHISNLSALRSIRGLHKLSSTIREKLRAFLCGPVELFITTIAISSPPAVGVVYSARDKLVKNSGESGVRLTAYWNELKWQLRGEQPLLIPLAHVLSTFAWPSVTRVTLTHSTGGCGGIPLVHPDPFATIDTSASVISLDSDNLREDLRLMSSVYTLTISVSRSTESTGIALMRTLASSPTLWPCLTHVVITTNTLGGCVSLSRGTWWRDVREFACSRAAGAFYQRTAGLQLVIEGAFCLGSRMAADYFELEGVLISAGSVVFECTCT
ncbi:hypothetical protein PENSPDRAFT_667357 [Peniophora sp. CONT]|nr:hypothetical protein PENSPDRAFT_667357 [Peniophora sp. CONT]